MTVSELISMLSSCNPDAQVVMSDGLVVTDVSTNESETKVFLGDEEVSHV